MWVTRNEYMNPLINQLINEKLQWTHERKQERNERRRSYRQKSTCFLIHSIYINIFGWLSRYRCSRFWWIVSKWDSKTSGSAISSGPMQIRWESNGDKDHWYYNGKLSKIYRLAELQKKYLIKRINLFSDWFIIVILLPISWGFLSIHSFVNSPIHSKFSVIYYSLIYWSIHLNHLVFNLLSHSCLFI